MYIFEVQHKYSKLNMNKGELTYQKMIRSLVEDAEDHSQGEGNITAKAATE